MRHYHKLKNHFHNPIINLDKLWTLPGLDVRACDVGAPLHRSRPLHEPFVPGSLNQQALKAAGGSPDPGHGSIVRGMCLQSRGGVL